MKHLPECDMSLCFIEQDKECLGERSCRRPNCNQWCVCQKLRHAFHRGYKAGQDTQKQITLDYGKRKYREALSHALKAINNIPWKTDETDLSLGRADGLGKAASAVRELIKT